MKELGKVELGNKIVQPIAIASQSVSIESSLIIQCRMLDVPREMKRKRATQEQPGRKVIWTRAEKIG